MRDIVLVMFILTVLATTLRFPFVGVLAWTWFTLMSPHQLAYGVFGLPLNLLIAATTIGSIAINGGFEKTRPSAMVFLVVGFAIWLLIAQLFSLDADASAEYFDRFIKTLLFVLICIFMATDKLRIHALLWTLMISLGFFAAKGAVFTLFTLGEYRVQGLEETMLEDNNHMGIALATTLPIILYLQARAASPLMRWGLTGLIVMTIISILGTHSRGAFLSLVVFAGFYWLQSKHKLAIIAALTLVMIPAVAFMPAKWSERMATIGSATQDASFMGRVDAWVINAKLAIANPVTGAGLRNSYSPEIAKEVDIKRAPNAKAAHSIYFEILGGAGFVGLAIFLGILANAFFTARGLFLANHRKKHPDRPVWIGELGYYLQISLAVFCVGGASVSLEMWDGYWIIVAIITALHRYALSEKSQVKPRLKSHLTAPKRVRWRMRARGKTVRI